MGRKVLFTASTYSHIVNFHLPYLRKFREEDFADYAVWRGDEEINRLMGNSLLDIIVFGRSAGRNAAEKSRSVQIGALTLEHVERFHRGLEEAGIHTDRVSPKLLPTYNSLGKEF